jgi:RNA polymerase sigma factor (sigma-70 family)
MSDEDRQAISSQLGIPIESVKDSMLTPSEQQCVADNMGIAGQVVKNLKRPGLPTEELRSAAYLALCHAALHYNPAKGARFSTYAWWVCYREVNVRIKELTGYDRNGKIRPNRLVNFTDMILPDPDMRYDPEQPVSREPDADVVESVTKALDALPARFSSIVKKRMKGMTLSAIAQEHWVSKERIRQIEDQAYDLMRDKLVNLM